MDIKFKLRPVGPRVFYLEFKDLYSMGMLFLRYQEFYESTNRNFKGKGFRIIDYMDWYTITNKEDAFTYTSDYVGYNIPSETLLECFKSIPAGDINEYDKEMILIHTRIVEEYGNGKYYLIAGADEATLKHELAHGLYYTDPLYKSKMLKLVNALPSNVKSGLSKRLRKIYPVQVINDEIQAYMSTGLSEFIEDVPDIKLHRQEFIKIFKSYYKLLTL